MLLDALPILVQEIINDIDTSIKNKHLAFLLSKTEPSGNLLESFNKVLDQIKTHSSLKLESLVSLYEYFYLLRDKARYVF